MSLEYHIDVTIFFLRKFVTLASLKVPSGSEDVKIRDDAVVQVDATVLPAVGSIPFRMSNHRDAVEQSPLHTMISICWRKKWKCVVWKMTRVFVTVAISISSSLSITTHYIVLGSGTATATGITTTIPGSELFHHQYKKLTRILYDLLGKKKRTVEEKLKNHPEIHFFFSLFDGLRAWIQGLKYWNWHEYLKLDFKVGMPTLNGVQGTGGCVCVLNHVLIGGNWSANLWVRPGHLHTPKNVNLLHSMTCQILIHLI